MFFVIGDMEIFTSSVAAAFLLSVTVSWNSKSDSPSIYAGAVKVVTASEALLSITQVPNT